MSVKHIFKNLQFFLFIYLFLFEEKIGFTISNENMHTIYEMLCHIFFFFIVSRKFFELAFMHKTILIKYCLWSVTYLVLSLRDVPVLAGEICGILNSLNKFAT